MKRRSLFAGLMAAFAPVAPVVAKQTSAPASVFVDNMREYTKLMNQKTECLRQLVIAEANRAAIYKAAYEDIAKTSQEMLKRLKERPI